MPVVFLLLLITLSIGTAATQSDPGWTPAGTRNGVTLAFRDDPQLNAREVRAITELPYASSRIVSLVCDFTRVLDPDVRQARVLSGNISSRYEIYLRYAPRFLVVAARDVVIDVKREEHGCAWSEVAGRMPPQSGAVRMPLLRGAWTIEPIDPMRSRVTYQIAVRPGGRIPGWMVRRGAARALPDVIDRVSKCLSSRQNGDGPCA